MNRGFLGWRRVEMYDVLEIVAINGLEVLPVMEFWQWQDEWAQCFGVPASRLRDYPEAFTSVAREIEEAQSRGDG